jgi:hypothetical protein
MECIAMEATKALLSVPLKMETPRPTSLDLYWSWH